MNKSLAYWWVDDLTCEDRVMLMNEIGYAGWKGTTEERRKKLVEMYQVWSNQQKKKKKVTKDIKCEQTENVTEEKENKNVRKTYCGGGK